MSRRIFALSGVKPEVLAYGMAKYSRSSDSMLNSLKSISEQKASDFLDTFYYQYGHASIADMAHIPLGIENVSILAAMTIEDEYLWDGQERSTRYQDFSKPSYVRPQAADADFDELVSRMFIEYSKLADEAFRAYAERYPMPTDMDKGTYLRTLKARAFDVARYWLPLATKTSLGQITSARTLEKQISRLLSTDYDELIDIANDMKNAVTLNKPGNIDDEPIAPTLIKYASRNESTLLATALLRKIAEQYVTSMPAYQDSANSPSVAFYQVRNSEIHFITTMLYSVTHFSYGYIRKVVENMTVAERAEIIDEVLQARGNHDEWLRQAYGAPLVFDMVMDIGAFRDLNRHRRAIRIRQDFTTLHGYDNHPLLHDLDLAKYYAFDMEYVRNQAKQATSECNSHYALPLATKCRSLFMMDVAQIAYMSELRTKPAGHPSYTRIVYEMFKQFANAYPNIAKHIRVTNPYNEVNPFQR